MSLSDQIQSIIEQSGAEMGVALLHVERDEAIELAADVSFPLCSVLKIPVLCEALRQIELGAFTLADRRPLTAPIKNIGSGVLTYLEDGLTPTVRDLLTLMIIISDNTATDMILERINVRSVNQFMHDLTLTDIHMALTIRGIFDDMLGEAAAPDRLLTNLNQRREKPPTNRAGRAFSSGSDNNVSTPREMTRLLAMIFRGEVVGRAACDEMLHILLQQQLNARLPLFLPYGIPFAHKTGTLHGIRNDAGILYAGEDSHVALTVFSRWDTAAFADDPVAEWECIQKIDRAFGLIGKAVYEHYR